MGGGWGWLGSGAGFAGGVVGGWQGSWSREAQGGRGGWRWQQAACMDVPGQPRGSLRPTVVADSTPNACTCCLALPAAAAVLDNAYVPAVEVVGSIANSVKSLTAMLKASTVAVPFNQPALFLPGLMKPAQREALPSNRALLFSFLHTLAGPGHGRRERRGQRDSKGP